MIRGVVALSWPYWHRNMKSKSVSSTRSVVDGLIILAKIDTILIEFSSCTITYIMILVRNHLCFCPRPFLSVSPQSSLVKCLYFSLFGDLWRWPTERTGSNQISSHWWSSGGPGKGSGRSIHFEHDNGTVDGHRIICSIEKASIK